MNQKDERDPVVVAAQPALDWQRALLDNFPFMVWLKDTDSRFVAVNRVVAEAAGAASPQALHGKTDLDYFPADLAEAYRADDREVMRTRQRKEVEEQIALGDERKWYETYKAPVEIDGVLVGTFGFAREIDDRKTVELKLRESEKRYRQILDNVSDFLCLAEVDAAGRCRILDLSASVETLAGVPREHWIGRYVDEAVPPAVYEALAGPLRRCVVDGVATEVELALPPPGAPRHVHLTVLPVRNCDGRTGRVLGVARDVSLLKKHVAVLHERARLQSRLKRLSEVAPGVVGTYRLGADGRASIPPPSPNLEEITGCSAESVQDDASVFVASVHDDDRAGYLASLQDSAQQMTPWHHEFRVRHPRKGEVWLEGRSIPERLPDGATEWYGFLHDVTDRKRVEAALRASESQFRALASRRENERELERKRVARELHDELGQSLTALRMRASLLRVQFGAGNPQLVESVAETTRLVDGTLEAIRGAVTALRPAALDMGVASALEWLVQEFGRHSAVACVLEVDESRVSLDDEAATAVFRIVQESLTNVARHAQATHVEVRLRRAGDEYLLLVGDDGRGFEPAQARRNLGLVGVRERVLALCGQLAIVSAPGAGTRIEVRFPAAPQGAGP